MKRMRLYRRNGLCSGVLRRRQQQQRQGGGVLFGGVSPSRPLPLLRTYSSVSFSFINHVTSYKYNHHHHHKIQSFSLFNFSHAANANGDPNTVSSSPPGFISDEPAHLPPPLSSLSLSQYSLDPTSDTYQQAVERTKQQVDDLNQCLEQVLHGTNRMQAVARHHERGKFLASERIERLVDPGTPVLHVASLVAHPAAANDCDETPMGAGIVTAIGIVAGKPCMLIANDATVKGGTYFPLTVKKHLRAQEIAQQNHLAACIYLVDSGGAYLPLQRHVFPDVNHFGRIFYNQAQMSALGSCTKQIAVVCGSCTAGGAYVPSMSDETVIVQNQGTIFLGGPPLVQAATGEIVTAQDLGGAVVHTTKSGVADHLAESELDALRKTRDIVASLGPDPYNAVHNPTFYEEPLFPVEELRGVVPVDPKQPLNPRTILARILDGSRFHEFKANYGMTLVTGFGKLYGRDVGILANYGILFGESALKGAHFIQLCDQRRIPLLFLQNITGFMVGSKYEHDGIAKHGAKLVTAVATSTIPKLTLVVGNSFGAGNYGMCGRAYSPRFLWQWPNAQIAVMGGEQAASVLWTVHKNNNTNKGKNKWTDEEEAAFKQPILERYQRESSAYFSTANLWDDGIIDPADTRRILGLSLAVACRGEMLPSNFAKSNHFGIFRM